MPKETIDDLRLRYKKVTQKEPAIRWNRQTLRKKITDAEILKAGYAQLENQTAESPAMFKEPKPDFEALAGKDNLDRLDQELNEEKAESRGGARPGAGRPVGQTDERARIERLLSLEKPDLGVLKIVQGFNLLLEKFTPLPFDKDQVESIALGFTLPLYYWFPSVEGAANKWTLHLQALDYIGRPVTERAVFITQMSQPIEKESENVKEKTVKEDVEEKGVEEKAGPAAPGPAAPGPAAKTKKSKSLHNSAG